MACGRAEGKNRIHQPGLHFGGMKVQMVWPLNETCCLSGYVLVCLSAPPLWRAACRSSYLWVFEASEFEIRFCCIQELLIVKIKEKHCNFSVTIAYLVRNISNNKMGRKTMTKKGLRRWGNRLQANAASAKDLFVCQLQRLRVWFKEPLAPIANSLWDEKLQHCVWGSVCVCAVGGHMQADGRSCTGPLQQQWSQQTCGGGTNHWSCQQCF